MQKTCFDLLVIGGGVNGAGIAADAAGRGLSVALIEAEDLASGTSSWSSKLIHGGLRYLEHYEFRLVREALAEREVLLNIAPQLVSPLRFILPHHKGLRPTWMIRIGLFLYDHLGKRITLPASKQVRFSSTGPLKSMYSQGFEYSDCRVDDARLVIMNAKLAENKGAQIFTRHKVVSAQRQDSCWQVTIQPHSGQAFQLQAKGLVNAAGPWVMEVLQSTPTPMQDKSIRLVKGSHIVVPKLHSEDKAYILQNADGRIVFVIPYLEDYSLIGTTDVDYQGDPRLVAIDDDEIDYLINITQDYFDCPLTRDDIVWTFSGVRPLMETEEDKSKEAAKATRDYVFDIQDEAGKLPLLSIFGGKLTTYRKLAEAAMNSLAEYYPNSTHAWTRSASLPGSDNFSDVNTYAQQLADSFPFLAPEDTRRISRTYGSLSLQWLSNAACLEDLGPRFGALFGQEVIYLIKQEWALSAEDILWRRTKTGINMPATDIARLQAFVDGYLQARQ